MTGTDRVLADLRGFLTAQGFDISADAFNICQAVERASEESNRSVWADAYLVVIASGHKPFRRALARRGADPDRFADYCRDHLMNLQGVSSPYDLDPDSMFSFPGDARWGRTFCSRPKLIDLAIEHARGGRRTEVTEVDLIAAVLADLDGPLPGGRNADYDDPQMQTPFNTLCHVVGGRYRAEYFIRTDHIREELGIAPWPGRHPDRTDDAPPEIRHSLAAFLVDHPDRARNCFIIMPFAESRLHAEVLAAVRKTLDGAGFIAHRADDRVYAEDVLRNIQTYIHGCRLAVAVVDRILAEQPNPNVALEIGYCLGLGKSVCLLKDSTLPKLQTDLVGRLYVEFDSQNIADSVPRAVERWLSDRQIAGANRS